jgi:flagellar basal-body rod protein FlgB
MIDLFANLAALNRSLDYHLARQGLLSSNVANAETPGYQPLDLRFDSYLARAGELKVTDPGHLGPSAANHFEMSVFADPATAPGNDGNTVSMEREMGKLSANSIRYRAATEMLSRRIGLLKYAATDGQRR